MKMDKELEKVVDLIRKKVPGVTSIDLFG